MNKFVLVIVVILSALLLFVTGMAIYLGLFLYPMWLVVGCVVTVIILSAFIAVYDIKPRKKR